MNTGAGEWIWWVVIPGALLGAFVCGLIVERIHFNWCIRKMGRGHHPPR